jgi:hypothetical protein
LFLGVKLTEILFHLRLRALKRLVFGKDKRYLQIMRHSMWVGIKVILAEVYEFFFQTKFSPQGHVRALPGAAPHSVMVSAQQPVSESPETALYS